VDLKFSSDGSRLAMASMDGSLYLYKRIGGGEQEWSLHQSLIAGDAVLRVDFSSSGDWVRINTAFQLKVNS